MIYYSCKKEDELMKKNILRILITLILGGIIYYLFYPPINLTSLKFWFFIILLLFIYGLTSVINIKETIIRKRRRCIDKNIIFFLSGILIFIFIIIVNFIGSPVFMSSKYADRIQINQNGVFEEDVTEVNYDALPLLDKESSQKLGDRVMGQMPELVSQYYVSDLYTQINYNDKIVRVTPLEYNGIIKYFTNRKKGVMGYITVDSVSGEAKLTKLQKGMKYMPSALFEENLYRHVQHKYKTLILDKAYFEIDNDGNPYWIIPTVKYHGIGIRKEISGVIIVNPITGSTKKYSLSKVPTWVDHVYPAELIIEQVDDWGKYKNGFINSVFSQKNVVATTNGYNYTVMNDDVYLYTGITSVANDESNLGFILTNLRTKDTVFYSVPGAEEYSAMSSAEGQVQQMGYKASFPLLINLNGKPTYLISLKDNAGLVKMYAFVDVANYQKVVVTDSSKGIIEASKNYSETNEIDIDKLITKDVIVNRLSQVNIDGTSYYYFEDENYQKYRASIKVNEIILPFLANQDKIEISYTKEENLIEIIELKIK